MSDANANRVDYAVSSDAGATWRTSVASAGEAMPFFFSNPSVAVDGARKWIYVAYARGGSDGVWDVVIAASHDDGKTWSRAPRSATAVRSTWCRTPRSIPRPARCTTPGTTARARRPAGSRTRPATSARPHAPAAARSTTCRSRRCRPSATARSGSASTRRCLVDDQRRVLHAVWSQPVAEDGTIGGEDLPRRSEAVKSRSRAGSPDEQTDRGQAVLPAMQRPVALAVFACITGCGEEPAPKPAQPTSPSVVGSTAPQQAWSPRLPTPRHRSPSFPTRGNAPSSTSTSRRSR